MIFHSLLRALAGAAGIALLASAHAHNGAPAGACPPDWAMTDAQLQGEWTGTVAGQPDGVRIELGPHPEWQGTVKGHIARAGARLPMVGDVDDNTVTLEESADGMHITATWLGEADPASCGREIRGDYLRGESDPPQTFILRKSPASAAAP